MTTLLALTLSCASFGVAWWLTGRLRQYALTRRVLDVPNARSSHSVATPRGGGMAIVAATVAALLAGRWLDLLDNRELVGLAGGGAVVSVIGFVDDHGHLRRRWRLLGHFVAATWVVAAAGGLPPIQVWRTSVDLAWVGDGLAVVYAVWVLNLTNFMDGIDGIAAVEAITVCLSGALIHVIAVPGGTAWIAPLLLAGATLGFLMWNWPPATIFMGDGGSCFLGLMLAALSIQAAWTSSALFWSWIVLLGVFVVDATVTVIRRAARGERIHDAHRTHAYQHAAQRCGSHTPVTLGVLAINVCWLLPIALLVARGRVEGAIGVIAGYTPLLIAAFALRAGQPAVKPEPAATGDPFA